MVLVPDAAITLRGWVVAFRRDGAPKKLPAPRKRKKRPKPVSLHPLDFDTAMKWLLAVPARETKDKRGSSD